MVKKIHWECPQIQHLQWFWSAPLCCSVQVSPKGQDTRGFGVLGFGVSWPGRKEPSSSPKEGPSQILCSLLASGKEA